MDGRQLRITANCAAALRRLLRGKASRKIWVNSIYISQTNAPEALVERGHQVAMMDRIYRNAVQVCVYLGPGDATSDIACAAIKELSYNYMGAIVQGPRQQSFRANYERLADDVLECTPQYPYGKLYGLFCLPWFRRYWVSELSSTSLLSLLTLTVARVVQEVALSRKATFYCGNYLFHLRNLISASDFTRLPYSKVQSNNVCAQWRSHLRYHFTVQEWIRQQEEPQRKRASGAGASAPRPTLADLLIPPALALEATRPEDKIYALHGICKRLGYAMQAPDYRKPLGAIYAETAREIIRSDRAGLDRLLLCVCESSGWEQGIPSWVPSFAGCIREWSPATPPQMFLHDRRDTRPAGDSACQFAFSADVHAISIKGRRLGTVCAVGQPWVVDNSATMLTGAHSMMPTDNNSILCLLESL
ncbi:hypothetical protein OQA88_13201 [Cercophora sp. LCS_1]